jgi:hypothetical protein
MNFNSAYIKLMSLGRHDLTFNLLEQLAQLRRLGVVGFLEWNRILLDAWLRDRSNQRSYVMVSESELRAARKSDTVFIFGSGYSLNDIPGTEWQFFEKHDTLGFTNFLYQHHVRVDYYLLRAGVESKEGTFFWRSFAEEYVGALNANPYFRNAIMIMQGEYLSHFCNAVVGHSVLRTGAKVFRYKTARAARLPTRSFRQGLSHGVGTLFDAVNFAYCLGWREIVLVGVDLYDSRYFWLKPDETLDLDKSTGLMNPSKYNFRGQRYDEPHNTTKNGVIQLMGQWREVLKTDAVEITVYNPRSLMAQVMPIYQRNESER